MKTKALLFTSFSKGFHPYFGGVDEQLHSIFDDVFDFARVTDDISGMSADKLREYGCIVMYSAPMWGVRSDSDMAAGLIDYIVNGGNLMVLHIISTGALAETAQIVGGRFRMHPPYNTYRIEPAKGSHAILEGIEPFTIQDEMHQIYVEQFLDRTPLLNCINADGREYANNPVPHQDIYAKNSACKVQLAWCHTFGMGRIVYSCPGHSANTFKNPMYRRFLVRCAMWLNRDIQ